MERGVALTALLIKRVKGLKVNRRRNGEGLGKKNSKISKVNNILFIVTINILNTLWSHTGDSMLSWSYM